MYIYTQINVCTIINRFPNTNPAHGRSVSPAPQ